MGVGGGAITAAAPQIARAVVRKPTEDVEDMVRMDQDMVGVMPLAYKILHTCRRKHVMMMYCHLHTKYSRKAAKRCRQDGTATSRNEKHET